MTAPQLLAALRARGVEVLTDGDRIGTLPPAAPLTAQERADILRLKSELLGLLSAAAPERAAIFRRQVAEWVPAARPGVPVLALDGVASRAGWCISCGVRLTPGQAWRCAVCLAAVHIALRDPDGPTASNLDRKMS
jgi:hypothetical protein